MSIPKSWFLPFTIFSITTFSSCGPNEFDVQRTADFWKDHGREFVRTLSERFHENHFEYVIHVHFMGNDFGENQSLENETKMRADFFPLAREALSEKDSALQIATDYHDPAVLGSLVYRHKSSAKANRAINSLFLCQDGKSELMKKTFVLGSGGSHGGYELQKFGLQLEKDCGKKIDLAILGDAIEQPGPMPMLSFKGIGEEGMCLQFWERFPKGFIKGAGLENCTNIQVHDANHWALAAYPAQLVRMVLKQLDSKASDLGITQFETNVEMNVEVAILEQKVRDLEKELEDLKKRGNNPPELPAEYLYSTPLDADPQDFINNPNDQGM